MPGGGPVRWERAVWQEGDVKGRPIVFLFEFDDDGVVLRQIELVGPSERPIVAASLVEWWEAQGGMAGPVTGDTLAYEARYGGTAEGSRDSWANYPGEEISRPQFEAAWRSARAYLESQAT
jgi:hypothetical protein